VKSLRTATLRALILATTALIFTFATASAATTTPYKTFSSHVGVQANNIVDILSAISDDADAYDIDAVAYDYGRLKSRANAELSWLTSHPPKSCYKSLYGEWKLSVQRLATAATMLRRYWLAWPSGSTHDFEAGLNALQSAGAHLENAKDLVSTTRC
jgi:hypothetical protein